MANVPAFEKASKEILGEYGCLPMIAYGTAKTLAAFKLLARARNLDFETSNEVSKQIKRYEIDVKHAIENNADDPDYDVDDDVQIEDYVDEKYLGLIEESKQYRGIVMALTPHACAHLLLDKDIRREIGVVRVKSKSGGKEPVYAAFIDGKTADAYNYLKADFLRVDVVKIIYETFNLIGIPVMTVNELLSAVENEPEVWDLYAKGFTMALNQVEREKSTERVMQYKPKNVCELTAFIAGIRPGFKSMLGTFIARDKFAYNIPSLDALLATKEIPDSFLLYDEQILQILIAAGIPAADAYACTKAIKKKKTDKVASYKERFKEGFTTYLKETEGATEEKAHQVVEQVWTIIENAANYMFCCAHAFSMACDSLYAAWLKVHYPYELYVTLLKLYDEKKNKDKIAQIISEMKRYKDINLIPGRFGQDNRNWTADKENKTISQSLSSIKFISKADAKALYEAGKKKYDTFTDVLREIQMNTAVDTRTIKILIELNYFADFGKSGKLMQVYNEYFKGEKKISKTVKSYEARLQACRDFENSLEDVLLPVSQRLLSESENIGLCLTTDPQIKQALYFVRDVDAKYGIKAKLYSIKTGRTGIVRIRKDDFARKPFAKNDIIRIVDGRASPKYSFRNGQRIPIPGEKEYWASRYLISEQADKTN